jgi:hypothetical protein
MTAIDSRLDATFQRLGERLTRRSLIGVIAGSLFGGWSTSTAWADGGEPPIDGGGGGGYPCGTSFGRCNGCLCCGNPWGCSDTTSYYCGNTPSGCTKTTASWLRCCTDSQGAHWTYGWWDCCFSNPYGCCTNGGQGAPQCGQACTSAPCVSYCSCYCCTFVVVYAGCQ